MKGRNRMKKLKKIIPFIMSLSLSLGCAPIAVFADDAVSADSSAESSVEDSTADGSVSDDNISDSTNEEAVTDTTVSNDVLDALTDSNVTEETTDNDISDGENTLDNTVSDGAAANEVTSDNTADGENISDDTLTSDTDVIIDNSVLDNSVSENGNGEASNKVISDNTVSNSIAPDGEMIVDFAAGTAVTTDENLTATTDIMTLEAPLDGISDPLGTAVPESLEANVLLGAPAPAKSVKEQIFDKLNSGLKKYNGSSNDEANLSDEFKNELSDVFGSVIDKYSEDELKELSAQLNKCNNADSFVNIVNGVTAKYDGYSSELSQTNYLSGFWLKDDEGNYYYTYCADEHNPSPGVGTKYEEIPDSLTDDQKEALSKALQAGYPFDSYGFSSESEYPSGNGYYTQLVIWDILNNTESSRAEGNAYCEKVFDYATGKDTTEYERIDKIEVSLKGDTKLNYNPDATGEGSDGAYTQKVTLEANKTAGVTLNIPDGLRVYDNKGNEIKKDTVVYVNDPTELTIVSDADMGEATASIGYSYVSYEQVAQDSIHVFKSYQLSVSTGISTHLINKPFQKIVGYQTNKVENSGLITVTGTPVKPDPDDTEDKPNPDPDNKPDPKPLDPVKPVDPVDPINPVDPIDPVEPIEPEVPEEPEVEIEMPDVPLSDMPVTEEAPETEVTSVPEEVNIELPDVPLSDAPETSTIVLDAPEGNLPQTGAQVSSNQPVVELLTAAFAVLAAMGIFLLRKKENN